jgi:hypothetical protein
MIYVKLSQCIGCTALTVAWHKVITHIVKVLYKLSPTQRLSTTTEVWPEGRAAGAVVADRLCFDPCSPQYSRLPINKYFFQPLLVLHESAWIWAIAFWIMEGRCNCASPSCGQVHTVTLPISSLFINAKLNTNLHNSSALWKPIRLNRQLKTTKYRLITIWWQEASCTDATGWYKSMNCSN